jgi:hypothetical protein
VPQPFVEPVDITPNVVEPEPAPTRQAFEPPAVITPVHNQVFPASYFMSRRDMDFVWKPVEGAESYTFKITKEGSTVPVYEAAHLKDCAVKLTDLSVLDRGTFVYQIEAIESASFAGEYEIRTAVVSGAFSISIPPVTAPKMISPGELFAY